MAARSPSPKRSTTRPSLSSTRSPATPLTHSRKAAPTSDPIGRQRRRSTSRPSELPETSTPGEAVAVDTSEAAEDPEATAGAEAATTSLPTDSIKEDTLEASLSFLGSKFF